jgi:hypothetical protein
VFAAETAYLLDFLKPGWKVLSVGCGPAHLFQGGLKPFLCFFSLDKNELKT